MSGVLHIFRVATPDVFQVDYTSGTLTYARTCTREQLEHIMVTPMAFDDDLIAKVLDELDVKNNTTVSDVSLTPNEASALGFEPMPSDA